MPQENRDILELKLSRADANCVLRSLAAANSCEDTDDSDRSQNTWIAERLLMLLAIG